MSVEQMRHRLLALSALCPGASTLLGNLLHVAGPSRQLRVRKEGGGGRGQGGCKYQPKLNQNHRKRAEHRQRGAGAGGAGGRLHS